jgi:hypothetical protein
MCPATRLLLNTLILFGFNIQHMPSIPIVALHHHTICTTIARAQILWSHRDLDTTRGLGNQGHWRLKICVINKPKFRVVNLKITDKMVVLASEGVWKISSYDDVLFLLTMNKFLRDISCKRQYSEESLLKAKIPEDLDFVLS